MSRVRVSTTVDARLVETARGIFSGVKDAALLDMALRVLLASNREFELDLFYAGYEQHPLAEADDWGDLESFGKAAGGS